MLEESGCSVTEDVDEGAIGIRKSNLQSKQKDFVQLWEIYTNIMNDGNVGFT